MTRVRSAAVTVLIAALVAGTLWAQSAAPKHAKQAGSTLEATLEKLERQGWEAYKNKNKNAYTALCTPDYTAVLADGSVNDLPGTLQNMMAVTIDRYSLADIKVAPLGRDAAVIMYKADVTVVPQGEQARNLKLAATDVFVKRAGQWKSIRYHESPAK